MADMPYWSLVSPLPLNMTCNETFAVSLDSEKYYTVDGKVPDIKGFDELSDIFKTKDGYVRLHTNFPQYVHTL